MVVCRVHGHFVGVHGVCVGVRGVSKGVRGVSKGARGVSKGVHETSGGIQEWRNIAFFGNLLFTGLFVSRFGKLVSLVFAKQSNKKTNKPTNERTNERTVNYFISNNFFVSV